MSLELTGKLIQKLPVQTGEGKNGVWSKGGFIIETSSDRFPKKVYCTVWGELINQVNAFQDGTNVKAGIDIESREYNGRWYTDVKVWRLEAAGEGSSPTSGSGPVDRMPDYNTSQEAGNDASGAGATPESTDDLPF